MAEPSRLHGWSYRSGIDVRYSSLAGCRDQLGSNRSGRLLELEALAAKHWPPLRRFEGDRCLNAALGALSARLRAR